MQFTVKINGAKSPHQKHKAEKKVKKIHLEHSLYPKITIKYDTKFL